jgi:hypothetical protein
MILKGTVQIIQPVKTMYNMKPGSTMNKRLKKSPGSEVNFYRNMHRDLMNQEVISYKLVDVSKCS